MNIFALHWRQRKVARWHCDKHVVKMLLETVQLLYTAHWCLTYKELAAATGAQQLARLQRQLPIPPKMETAPKNLSGSHYRPVHSFHPCAKWTRRTSGNYQWLAKLAIELAAEFRFRYGHDHACQPHAEWLVANMPAGIRKWPRTEFVMAMDERFKISQDPIVSYRHFYRVSKGEERGLLTYTKRHIPHWLMISTNHTAEI